MANENMGLIQPGWAALPTREQAAMAHYNDLANNCTYGVGTLAHTGPCTPEELRRPVTISEVNAQLVVRVSRAESHVRRTVTQRAISRGPLDRLVSRRHLEAAPFQPQRAR
ncbi:hypothetical protein [Paraburkholderia ferrariae]|uniref:hypothetical protein n=1 Tax=Paraburkholderia ferrariae TaxID=386056 RepID=UPI0012EC36BB|nr:hypothetical protein [Paraburkholderia ferrariae]